MTTLVKKIDRAISAEWKLTRMQKAFIMGLCLIVMAGISYASWTTAAFKSELDAQKYAARKAIDKTPNFGEMLLNEDGKIISWNKGMTAQLGWTSDEMCGQSIDRLDPQEHDTKAFVAIGDPQEWPWMEDGALEVKTKSGRSVLLSVRIRDFSGKDGKRFRRISFDPYPESPTEPLPSLQLKPNQTAPEHQSQSQETPASQSQTK